MRTIEIDDPENKIQQLIYTIHYEIFREQPTTIQKMIKLTQKIHNAGLDDNSGHTTIEKLRNPLLADTLSSIFWHSRDAT